jgi:hypothetical protein
VVNESNTGQRITGWSMNRLLAIVLPSCSIWIKINGIN